MANRDDYRFLPIKDAMVCLNQRVNLIGVIAEFGVPLRSRGTDWFCSLKIIDKSYHSPGISVNIFEENVDKLPHVVSAGDIILLSHVVIKNYGTEVYAVFNKKFSAFALFEGKTYKNLDAYQVSAKHQPKDRDKKFIAETREWLCRFQFGTGSEECVSLREIRENEKFDLVCKILHNCQIKENEWMLFIWDGTDAPPLSIKEKLEDEVENPLPLQVESVPLPRHIFRNFPGVGTVLRVTDQSNEKMAICSLTAGKWVRFMNMTCEVHAGLWHGVLTPSSKIRYLPDEGSLIVQRQRSYDDRISVKFDRMPQTAFPWPSLITATDHGHVSFLTLMDILSFSKVTAKFRCVVRVVAAYPWRAEDLRSPSGVYRVRLTLEDPTARIRAYVYAEDGEIFFEGFPPVDVLTRKLNKLLGVSESDDAPRSPPWVDCCLKSYYIVKTDPWETRNFRICDTRLVG